MVSIIQGVTGIHPGRERECVPCIRADGFVWTVKAGDHLTVWNDDGTILFAGIVFPVSPTDSWFEVNEIPPQLREDVEHAKLDGYRGSDQWFIYCTTAQLGRGRDDWTGLFLSESAGDNGLDRGLSARLIRLPLLNWWYGFLSVFYLHPLTRGRNTFLQGTPYGYFETGMEGMEWTVYRKPSPSRTERLLFLEAGDIIWIRDKSGKTLYVGMIIPDSSKGRMTPDSRPQALGLYIHWTQSGFQPDDWARFFFQEGVTNGRRYLEDSSNQATVVSFAPLLCLATLIMRHRKSEEW